MKTTKFFLIAALLSFSILTFTQADHENNHFSIKISLKIALHDPGLVRAMYEQLNQDFLNGNQELQVYSVAVKYRGSRYVIYGSYQEWINFFLMDYDDQTPETALQR
jgi:hypothetical protein